MIDKIEIGEGRSLKKKGFNGIPLKPGFFFQASSFQLLKLEIHCEDHTSPSYIYPQFIYESFHILHVKIEID